MNNGTCSEEQQRLEKCVCEEVEYTGTICTDTQSNEHISKLGTCRIGNDLLDIVLYQPDSSSKKCCCCSDYNDKCLCGGCKFENRRHTGYHKDTGCNHRRRVNKCRNRRRAFHSVGQPRMQEKLG